jgi:hypothetical protein
MGVSITVMIRGLDGYNRLAEDGAIEAPHWTYSNWYRFYTGVNNALKDAYVTATAERNKTRRDLERSEVDHQTSAPFGTSNLAGISLSKEFHRQAQFCKHLAELKAYWSEADDPDGCVWSFDSKVKFHQCLVEAAAHNTRLTGFVERDRLNYVLEYLDATKGDGVTVA